MYDPTQLFPQVGRISYKLFPGGLVNSHENLEFTVKVLTLIMSTWCSLPNLVDHEIHQN